ASGPAPTGTVAFVLYNNGNCSGTGASAGGGSLASGASTPQGPLEAGSYSFKATYSGDSNYASQTGPCETITISKGTTTTTTKIKEKANGKVQDKATVAGQVGAIAITGTVTFTFWTNGTCTGTGSPAGTNAVAAGIAKSNAMTPPPSGPYSFKATYNGDSNYT